MRLTNFSDISFRVLLYAAAHEDRLVTIDEMTETLKVSRGHLMKVVHNLTSNGFLISLRGRGGGLKLGKKPGAINLADVLRKTETDFAQVECMREGNECTLTGFCKLPNILHEAMRAYLQVLSKYTLEDVDVLGKLRSSFEEA